MIGISFTGSPGEGKIEINNREAPSSSGSPAEEGSQSGASLDKTEVSSTPQQPAPAPGAGGAVVKLGGALVINGQREIKNVKGNTLAEALQNLPQEVREQILNPDGTLKEHAIIGINGKEVINAGSSLNTHINPSDKISIMLRIDGGAQEASSDGYKERIEPAPISSEGAEVAVKLTPQITSNGMEMEILGRKFRVVDVRDEMGYYVIQPLEEFYSRSEGNDFAIKIRNHISEKLGIPIKETSIEGLIVIEDEARGRIMSIRQIEEDFIWIDIEGEWSLYDVFGYKEGKSTMEEWIKAQPVDAQPRLSKIAETMVKNDYGAPGLSPDDRAFWNMYLASDGIIKDEAEEIEKQQPGTLADEIAGGVDVPKHVAKLITDLSSQGPAVRKRAIDDSHLLLDKETLPEELDQELRVALTRAEQELKEFGKAEMGEAKSPGGIDGSAPLTIDSRQGKPGGIDFSALPIQTLGTVPKSLAGTVPKLDNLDLDAEWQKIEDLVNSGEIPSAESIKEYLQASCLNGSAEKDIDKVIACIADILRIEEELYIPTEPMLIDILIAVESASSLIELKAAFIGNS